ncbi:MAG: Fe(3+) ABC transporter substrate-binding protein [Proteobacteria bacterium]|nr:Fe(3+) ABC transporter substrate-binding protein [Pseudomonadota bacterium]
MDSLTARRAGRYAALTLLTSVTFGSVAQAAGEVNIYSYRQPYLIAPLLKDFTAKTGIKANVIYAKKGLIERIAVEGRNSPADVLLTVDIGRLTGAVSKGISQPVNSATLNNNIPAAYRDPSGHWFGLTARARVVYASKARVAQNAITYEELADPKWKGKICIRSGQHAYNVALIASMIAHHGEQKAQHWLEGLKANLAQKPAGSDRAQVKGVFSGVCDIAIGNSYYMAKMQTNDKNPEQKQWANAVKLLFPNSEGRGVHINISGIVLAKYAPNKANGIALMEYLSSAAAQKIYAQVNHEYPVRKGVAWSARVKSWGTFKPDPLALEMIARLRKKASELVDKVRFNDGPGS